MPSRLTAVVGGLTLLATVGVNLAQDRLKDFVPDQVAYAVMAVGLFAYGVAWSLGRRPTPPPAPRATDAAPPPPAELVGRDAVVAAGIEQLARSRLLLVHGPRNIGTSAVALAVARGVLPDERGHVYVDLRAREAGSSESRDRVKVRVLSAVGLTPPRPRSDEEAAEQVRAVLAHTGRVLLLDNARTADQIGWLARPVPGAYVVVAGDVPPQAGVDDLPVGPLAPADGLALLRRGPLADRVPATGAEVDRLARYLKSPEVVRVVRSWLIGRPGVAVPALLADLEGRGSPPEEPAEVLRRVLALQTAGLSADARRLLALLPHVPVAFLPVGAAAGLLGRTPQRAERALDELARAAVIEAVGAGRYGIPREARALGQGSPPRGLPAALGRLLRHYAEAAEERARVLRERRSLPADADADDPAGAVAAAVDWFRAEDLALLALLRSAPREQLPARATSWLRTIADALEVWFRRDRRPAEREAAAAAELTVARRLADPAGQQTALLRLAAVARSSGRLVEAAEQLARAKAAGRGAAAQARWSTEWGLQALAAGDVAGARTAFEGNLARRPERDPVGLVTDRVNLGAALIAQGELDPAVERLRDAAVLAAGEGDPVGLAYAQELLGVVAARRRRTADALEVWSDAQLLYERVHDEPGQARCLLHTGTVLADGRPAAARSALRRSLALRGGVTGVGVALTHLLLARLEAVEGRPEEVELHRAEARAALAPWEGRLDPPAEVVEIHRQLDCEE